MTGGSLAEEAGMNVGDMIIEINGDNTAQITHSEAQQCILEAGNNITLSILRWINTIILNTINPHIRRSNIE